MVKAAKKKKPARKPTTCPVLKLRSRKYSPSEFVIEALHGSRIVGDIYVHVGRYAAKSLLVVESIDVSGDVRRCGVGTKLYEAAAKLACSRGLRLASDTFRTEASDGFWAKQVAKKRAVCSEPSIFAIINPQMAVGRSGCRYYTLKRCPATTLAGARRKRK
jgi:hypothetical protein